MLYNRQGEARARAQALLAELEDANRQLAEYAARVEELTLANERQRMARELHDTLSQGLAGLILQLEAADAHLAQRPRRAGAGDRRSRPCSRRAPPWPTPAGRSATCARRPPGEPRPGGVRAPGDRALHRGHRHPLPSGDRPARAAAAGAVRGGAAHGGRGADQHRPPRARQPVPGARWPRADGWLEVRIADDGAGFDPADAESQAGHYGLLGMRERARLAGGTLDDRQPPGAGTTLVLRLPLED